MLEIEFKNMLSEAEYHFLMAHFGKVGQALPQTNVYFDTAGNDLKKNRMSLRIRKTVSGFELTLKQPHESGGKLETNQDLSEVDAEKIENLLGFVEGPVKAILNGIGINPDQLNVVGYLVTDRVEFPYEGGTLFLDHSKYNGKEDFELEFEAESYKEGLLTFQSVLAKFQIPVRHGVSKIKRATTP
ncbi:MAG: CYTH domain-containing protein [Turicibacter sp.]|nr:CYTH domain-containing protein [Turicibacter sp.]